MEQLSRSIKESERGHNLLLEISPESPVSFEDNPEFVAQGKDTEKGKNRKKKKKRSKRGYEMPMFEDNEMNGHQQSRKPKHVLQTQTELKQLEIKARKSKMENNGMQPNVEDEMDVSDPQEQTQRGKKNKLKELQTQREDGENALVDVSSCKKKKKEKSKHEDRSEQLAIDFTDMTVPVETRKPKKKHKSRPGEEMNSVLSKSEAGVSDITVPKVKKKHKKKQHEKHTESEGGVEIQTASITANNPENVDLNTKKYNDFENLSTYVHADVNKKRKRKNKCLTERVLHDSPHQGETHATKKQTSNGGSAAVTAVTMGEAGTDGATEENGVRPIAIVTGTQRAKSNKKRCSVDLQALNELKEYISNVEARSSSEVQKILKYDLPRFRQFKEEGIEVRSGRFTAQDNETLMNNVYDFMALTGVKNASSLFHPQRYNDNMDIRKLKSLYKFQERIVQGIPRLTKQIYVRGRKMFDESNYRGRFTEEELCSLTKCHELYGNNWTKISKFIDRSDTALEKRFSQISEKNGKWSEKEQKHLIHAVRDFVMGQAEQSGEVAISISQLCSGIPWKAVSERVKRRHWVQCRDKWMSILNNKIKCRESESYDATKIRIRVDLIKELNAMQVEEVSGINWEELASTIGNVTPYYIQKLYYRLKVCNVPLWQSKTFCEIIDILYTRVLPKLEKHLKDYLKSESQTEGNNLYLLSEIFDDSEVENID